MPGKLAEGVFFYADSDDVASVSEMTNVEMVIEVWDNDTYETLASYDVTLNQQFAAAAFLLGSCR